MLHNLCDFLCCTVCFGDVEAKPMCCIVMKPGK